MIEPSRLLGFAFANADILFELDMRGTILFVTGALGDFGLKESDIVGHGAVALFQPADAGKLVTLAQALGNSDRGGPLRLKLPDGADVHVAMCRLPQNAGRISCTLARAGVKSAPKPSVDRETGLFSREGFLAAMPGLQESDGDLALVHVPWLPEACKRLGAGEGERLLQRIGASIRNSGAKLGGRLSPTSFGAIAHAMKGANPLGAAIRNVLHHGEFASFPMEQTLVSLKARGLSPEQRALAVRYAVDRFAAGDPPRPDMPHDLAGAFEALLESTQSRALALTETMVDGNFRLAYQPIVDLKSGAVSHYEALARFDAPESTGEIVGFAEALGIADAFDLAVLVKLLAQMQASGAASPKVAFNISGHTIMSPPAFGLLAGLLGSRRALARHLLVEITETAEITDLVAANGAIQVLREMGFEVGIDDFGAGAASLKYLHGLSVDFVKVDGALVRKLGDSARDDQMLAGIVKLCGELGIRTIAEYIEDDAKLKRARAIGFDLGQGHCFGAAAPEFPQVRHEAATQLGKRKGVREQWG